MLLRSTGRLLRPTNGRLIHSSRIGMSGHLRQFHSTKNGALLHLPNSPHHNPKSGTSDTLRSGTPWHGTIVVAMALSLLVLQSQSRDNNDEEDSIPSPAPASACHENEKNLNAVTSNPDALEILKQWQNDPELIPVVSPKLDKAAPFRNFIRSKHQFGQDNHRFEYFMFFNPKEQRIVALVFFGSHTEGPPGCVHGGAIATILDAAFGTTIVQSNNFAVTANLNVNYRRFIPLRSVVLLDARIEKTEGRKVQVMGSLRSLDGGTLHAEASSLFIFINNEEIRQRFTKTNP